MDNHTQTHDTVIIGSGLAGMTAALHLAEHCSVALIFEGDCISGATPWAQGGLSAVSDSEDSFSQHAKDTWDASAQQGKTETIALFVEQCPREIEWLIELGIPFTTNATGDYSLHREGGHSARRIFHTHDHTGLTLAEHFAQRVQEHPNINCYHQHTATELLTALGRVQGVRTWQQDTQHYHDFFAPHTILATGGAVGLYPLSTCPQPAYGAGIAMAHQAGAVIKHMEFTQFHPTRFCHPDSPPFLISEALRGEGALLLTQDGERFMPQFHPQAELAPRDVVSRAIYQTIQKHQHDHVYLDIRHRSQTDLEKAFPRIAQHCAQYGLHLHHDLIPVSPAAHYTCGGVNVNRYGQTSLPGLYAIGETANTGIHGANRLASNSLSECLVFARATTDTIRAALPTNPTPPQRKIPTPNRVAMNHPTHCTTAIQTIHTIMHQYLGIARTTVGIQHAHTQLHALQQQLDQQPHTSPPHVSAWKVKHMLSVATLITTHALHRKISCGAHYLI